MSQDMPRCRDCRWWVQTKFAIESGVAVERDGLRRGVCSAFPKSTSNPEPGSACSMRLIHTDIEFGCVQFEVKA